MTVVEYAVATGPNVTPDEASDGRWPGREVRYLDSQVFERTAVHYYLVEQPDGPLDFT